MNKELKMVEHLIKLTKNDAMEWYVSSNISFEKVNGVYKTYGVQKYARMDQN